MPGSNGVGWLPRLPRNPMLSEPTGALRRLALRWKSFWMSLPDARTLMSSGIGVSTKRAKLANTLPRPSPVKSQMKPRRGCVLLMKSLRLKYSAPPIEYACW
jgi:hypothetical protein